MTYKDKSRHVHKIQLWRLNSIEVLEDTNLGEEIVGCLYCARDRNGILFVLLIKVENASTGSA